MRAAVRDGEDRVTLALDLRIETERDLHLALVVDLVDEARADLVAIPRQAEQGFVEMGVRLYQAGDQDAPTAVDDLGPLEGSGGKEAVHYMQVGGGAAHGADIAKGLGRHGKLPELGVERVAQPVAEEIQGKCEDE